ncbi:MobV family relaxase [Marinomonas pollencensis]|uniref:Plasmid recombination enzyme n=1 Tax=Marinomonas pollencensis TaxID=491954 RepID=A0A3E0D4S9_9GAMM|nr:MobV family relaxase [Marinomonas pollencensis]REG77554.1 plasmid recombination enzyme [Marinomonas pollencensis]
MYSIMRTKKHKATGGGLKAALQHLYRERDTPNADRSVSNLKWGDRDGEQTTENSMRKLHSTIASVVDKTGRKLRSDAVVAVEYVMTASPEYFDQFTDKDEHRKKVSEFANTARSWIEEQYPDGTIIAAQVHMDEATPHVSLFVTPTIKNKEGVVKFNARERIGGRQKLSEHQDSFAKATEHLGLKRGIKGSKATHEKVSRFYSKVIKSLADVENIYTEDAVKIQALANKRIGGKGEIAEFAMELSHDNLKLRHLLAENSPQRQIEAVSKAHTQEIKEIKESYNREIKRLRSDLTSSRERESILENQLKTAAKPYVTQIENLQIEISKGDKTIEKLNADIAVLERDFDINYAHLSAYTSLAWGEAYAESEDVLQFRGDATYQFMSSMIDQGLQKMDDFNSNMVKEFENYESLHNNVNIR